MDNVVNNGCRLEGTVGNLADYPTAVNRYPPCTQWQRTIRL